MTTPKPITILRKEIMASIKRPDFLDKGSRNIVTLNDIAWNNTYDILYNLLDCVRTKVLNDKQISEILGSISKASYDLDVTLSGKQLLYLWVWIHSMIQMWLDLACEASEYETASNLKKIIVVIYDNNVSTFEEN